MKIISLTGASSSGKDSILQAVLRVNIRNNVMNHRECVSIKKL